ncbi:iron complex transport system permease protein [Kutzneria viridogrisea]|nr:iron ABC transporter permease [Kutzneria albida]MBA8930406.1 iron complex transport system permease protein [Kutzneria viridogrisea]
MASLLLVTLLFGVALGPVSLSVGEVFSVLASHATHGVTQPGDAIVWQVRAPRVLLGAVAGACLAATGVAVQALVRNALADPFLLGVSSGASVGASSVLLFGALAWLGSWALTAGAFLGGLAAMLAVFALARTGGRLPALRLVLSGTAMAYVFSAMTSLLIYLAPNAEGARTAIFWLLGSLGGASWQNLLIPAIAAVLGLGYLAVQAKALDALAMGDEAAGTLGVDVRAVRTGLYLVTALVTGAVVAAAGAIGFVGLMLPHLVRLLVGAGHRRVLPASALLGALFLVWTDVAARMVVAPEELPLGVITAVFGGPVFLFLLRRRSYAFGGVAS